jgi:hypothetical protein
MNRNSRFSGTGSHHFDHSNASRWALLQQVLLAPVVVEERCHSIEDVYSCEPNICSVDMCAGIAGGLVAAVPAEVAAEETPAVALLPPPALDEAPPPPPPSPVRPTLRKRRSIVDVVLELERNSLRNQYTALRKLHSITETEIVPNTETHTEKN